MICSFHLTLLSFNVKLTFAQEFEVCFCEQETPPTLIWLAMSIILTARLCSFCCSVLIYCLLAIDKRTLFFLNISHDYSCVVSFEICHSFLQMSPAAVLLWAKTLWSVVVTDMGLVASADCLCWPLLFAGSLSALPRRSQFIDNLSDMACSLSPRWVSAGPVASCRSESEGGTRSEEVFTCRAG